MDDSAQQHFHNYDGHNYDGHKYDGVTMMSTEISVLNPTDSHCGNNLSHTTEQQRLTCIHELGLLNPSSTPVFDEATQTAAHFLNTPICILGVMNGDRQHFKAAIGLSRIGLMNDLAVSRQLPRHESFCNTVVELQQKLLIEDTLERPEYQNYVLVTRYGIRSYLGVPVIASSGQCVGTLFVMDLVPRTFTGKDIAFLELIARWSISEFERNTLIPSMQPSPQFPAYGMDTAHPSQHDRTQETELALIKANLITKMAQELRTPLTSIIGMTSVLIREIYGPLTDKQKEYMDIVHSGSQYMHSLVSEIVELHNLKEDSVELELSQVDIEMLCQQALASLEDVAQRQEQTIQLSVEPGRRMWLLDKSKVRQLVYHLVFRVIQYSTPGSTVRVHVSRKDEGLNLSIWTSHPWLDDTSNHVDAYTSARDTLQLLTQPYSPSLISEISGARTADNGQKRQPQSNALLLSQGTQAGSEPQENCRQIRQNLGLVLSQKLTTLHGGSISLQGSSQSGYRYVITLPRLDSKEMGNPHE
ncbi:MAG: GAF domain-containing sensor histidine kinase [Leptolyngbyaceae bacterium]|nr:GAF domain-containing sensor histidine kinase [Leptolyngbyaceae bacterium]